MQPTVSLDRTVVAVRIGDIVHVMLELQAPPAPPVARPPLDVAVVIDRSGSMGGAPLESVTRATASLLRLAGPDDRLGVVAFDDRVDLVLPLAHHDADLAAGRVLALRPGGSTNLSGGWLKGLELLRADPRAGALTRVVVLTDGQANHGIVEPERLAELAAGAKEQGVTTSCIGFGDRYDEALLALMADAGAGNDYWCAGPDQAAAVFVDELGGLASVVAQNVSVELRPVDGVVDAFGVLNDFPVTRVPGGMQVALGDAYGDERRRVVAVLELLPQADPGPVHVADLVLRWVSVSGPVAMHTVTLPVTIEFGTDPDLAEPNPEVAEQVRLLTAVTAREEARRAADEGRYDEAARSLRTAAAALDGIADAAVQRRELLSDAERLERQDWDHGSSKRLHSTNRTQSKGRRSRYDDPAGS